MADINKISSMTFDQFDDSFNIALDIRNEDFDWFDNPYIFPNVYYLDQEWKPTLHPLVRMKRCDKQDLNKILPKYAFKLYPNALCFEDKSKIKMKNSWNEQNFENMYIAIDFCNPKTYHGVCKSHDEIKQFLSENIFSLIN